MFWRPPGPCLVGHKRHSPLFHMTPNITLGWIVGVDVDKWTTGIDVRLQLICAGKQILHPTGENFNVCLWAGCLNQSRCISRVDSSQVIKVWRKYYNPSSPRLPGLPIVRGFPTKPHRSSVVMSSSRPPVIRGGSTKADPSLTRDIRETMTVAARVAELVEALRRPAFRSHGSYPQTASLRDNRAACLQRWHPSFLLRDRRPPDVSLLSGEPALFEPSAAKCRS